MREINYNYDPGLARHKGRARLKLVFLATLLIALLGFVGFKKIYPRIAGFVEAQRNQDIVNNVQDVIAAPEQTAVSAHNPVPASARLKVPYTIQAPNNTWHNPDPWGFVHEESCEEAALLMDHDYIEGKSYGTANVIPASTALKEMDDMITWQKTNYGKEGDLTLLQIGKMAESYYGYKYRLIENLTADEIKQEIADGNVVLVPVMTAPLRDLGGGHYSSGSVYHIVPIIGYNTKGVITNDQGFGPGQNWFYTWSVIFKAMDAQTKNTPHRMGLVLYKAQ